VLGSDVVVLQGAGLVLGQDDYLPGSLGEAFEQVASSFPRESAADSLKANRSEQVGG
jgi:hypothetical protein